MNSSEVIFVNFNLNCGLHTTSVEKLSERMSNFWMVLILETESEPIFGFPHTPSEQLSLAGITRQSVKVIWPLPADKSVNC